MLVFSTFGLFLEGNFDKFRQEVADHFAEDVFDAIFPFVHDQTCTHLINPGCGIVTTTWWAVKTVTYASWMTSIITLLSALVDRYREGIETVLYYAKEFALGLFVFLPIEGIGYVMTLPARVRGTYHDDYL